MTEALSPPPETRRALIAAGIEAETAFRRSLRRFLGAGFAIGFLLGGLFGAQAILSEGWWTGLWFVFGVGVPAGLAGAALAAPAGILRGFARRKQVVRSRGFSMEQVQTAAAEEI